MRIFATIFGMVLANAFLCYGYEEGLYRHGTETMTYKTFLDRLTAELCPEMDQIPVFQCAQDQDGNVHKLQSLSEAPKYHERGKMHVRLQCRICHKKCSHYCTACSSGNDLVAIHDPNNPLSGHKDCFDKHIELLKAGKPSVSSDPAGHDGDIADDSSEAESG